MAGLLRGKCVAVTGSSSGIGRAIALACASQGARLFLHRLNTPQASTDMEALQKELKSISEMDHVTFGADVTQIDIGKTFTQAVASSVGKLDVLVNNAGICQFSPFHDVSQAMLESHLAVNFTAPYMLAQAVSEQMVAHGTKGSIVNIASITATLGSARLTHYSPTKAAILGMTVSCAVALGNKGVRFNSVYPGTIETAMNKADLDKDSKRAEMAARVPLGRLGQPDDIADAVVFFASDSSRYVTGQSLLVDGGASINYQ